MKPKKAQMETQKQKNLFRIKLERTIDKRQRKRANVDTTVQEKAIRYPTDAALYGRVGEIISRS